MEEFTGNRLQKVFVGDWLVCQGLDKLVDVNIKVSFSVLDISVEWNARLVSQEAIHY